jgi:hypothetical protein
MLVAMNLASCKMSNKPAVETSRIGEIPEAAQYIVGLEKFNTPIDYSQAECWLDVPAAMVKDGVLDATADVKENLGSLTYDGKLVTPGIADARVDTARGSVVVTTADAKLYAIPADGAAMFGPESYHLHDYGFFFNNFKQNVADRVKAFLEK